MRLQHFEDDLPLQVLCSVLRDFLQRNGAYKINLDSQAGRDRRNQFGYQSVFISNQNVTANSILQLPSALRPVVPLQ